MIQTEQTLIIAMLGPPQCGKTTLINSHFHNLHTQSSPTTAIEISYSMHQTDEGTRMRVKCWDTSGEERYKGMVCYHIKDAHLVFAIFQLNDRKSQNITIAGFQKINEWIDAAKKEKAFGEGRKLFLVGNKLDLVYRDPTLRKVQRKLAEEKAKSLQAKYVEISAKDHKNLSFLNDALEEIICERAQRQIEQNQLSRIKTDLKGAELIDTNGVKAGCDCKTF